MPTITLAKGQKKVLTRQCLKELGTGASFGQAKKWFKKNHNLTLADATFYHVRQDMRREAALKTPPTEPTTTREVVSGIVDLVKTAKELVDKLGKEDTIKLIDLL
jgi:hypothetical protein